MSHPVSGSIRKIRQMEAPGREQALSENLLGDKCFQKLRVKWFSFDCCVDLGQRAFIHTVFL